MKNLKIILLKIYKYNVKELKLKKYTLNYENASMISVLDKKEVEAKKR